MNLLKVGRPLELAALDIGQQAVDQSGWLDVSHGQKRKMRRFHVLNGRIRHSANDTKWNRHRQYHPEH